MDREAWQLGIGISNDSLTRLSNCINRKQFGKIELQLLLAIAFPETMTLTDVGCKQGVSESNGYLKGDIFTVT